MSTKNRYTDFPPQIEIKFDIMKYIYIFFKYWKLISITSSVVSVVTFFYVMTVPPKYKAQMVILAGSAKNMTDLKSLAAQFGLINLDESILNSPEVYKEIIKSRNLIDAVTKKEYKLSNHNTPQNLETIFKISSDKQNSKKSHEKVSFILYKTILKSITIETDVQSPIVKVYCETIDPELSAELLSVILGEIEKFNNQVRNIKARINLVFVEKRLNDTKVELQKAEEKLNQFRKINKHITDSPDLQLQLGRLMREVEIKEEIFLTLSKEYELAKIQEIKDAPVIDVIEKPVSPFYKSYPKRIKTMIFSIILSFFISFILVYCIDYIKKLNK